MVGPMVRNADGSVYESGRVFPSVTDAVGHAFLGTLRPDNPFTRRYHMDGWDRTTERDGRLDLGLLHARATRRRSTRSGCSTRDSRCTARSWISRPVSATPAAPCSTRPRSRSCTRSASRSAGRDGCGPHALAEHPALLPEAPGRRMAEDDGAGRRGPRSRSAPSWSGCEGGSWDEGRGARRGRGDPDATPHRDHAETATAADGPALARPRTRPSRAPRRPRGGPVVSVPGGRRSTRSSSRVAATRRSCGSPRPKPSARAARS